MRARTVAVVNTPLRADAGRRVVGVVIERGLVDVENNSHLACRRVLALQEVLQVSGPLRNEASDDRLGASQLEGTV